MPGGPHVCVSTGRYDIFVETFLLHQKHFLDFISTRLGRMDGASLEPSIILGVVKFSYEWEIPDPDRPPRGCPGRNRLGFGVTRLESLPIYKPSADNGCRR